MIRRSRDGNQQAGFADRTSFVVVRLYIQRKMAQYFAPRGQRVVIMSKAGGTGHG